MIGNIYEQYVFWLVGTGRLRELRMLLAELLTVKLATAVAATLAVT